MAMIDQVVDRHFHVGESALADPSLIIVNLDTGIYSVGKMVACLRDQVIHGSPGTGQSDCDTEEVGAGLEALLAYLGQLGAMVDQLQACDRANRLTVAAKAA
ncbi:hypothetical protein LTR94_024507 [Friedmanniomyces endolithicus]|nr:hypothetical protein LTR94_024507 [Friedmanniomyces endolithicus]